MWLLFFWCYLWRKKDSKFFVLFFRMRLDIILLVIEGIINFTSYSCFLMFFFHYSTVWSSISSCNCCTSVRHVHLVHGCMVSGIGYNLKFITVWLYGINFIRQNIYGITLLYKICVVSSIIEIYYGVTLQYKVYMV